MQSNEDSWLEQWETIVSEVHKTDVPIECVKKVVFKVHGGKQQTVNIHTLRKQGLEFDEIEGVLTRKFEELDEVLRDVEFMVDITAVAAMIQPETDKLLGKLCE